MQAALEQAYQNQKMVGRFPGCVLHLTTRLNGVDVNVHPTKTEVKFTSEKKLFDAVYYAAKAALEEDSGAPRAVLEERPKAAPKHDSVTANQTFFSALPPPGSSAANCTATPRRPTRWTRPERAPKSRWAFPSPVQSRSLPESRSGALPAMSRLRSRRLR